MAKLFALTKIILPPDDKNKEERLVAKGQVFNATPDQAKQFDGLKAARPATDEEIAAAKEAQAVADGTTFVAPAPSDPVLDQPADTVTSTASGDPKALPKALPKGKSA